MRRAINTLGDLVAGPRTREAQAAAAPGRADDVRRHGDLLPGDVLVHESRLVAVVDRGSPTAVDLGAARHLPDRLARGPSGVADDAAHPARG